MEEIKSFLIKPKLSSWDEFRIYLEILYKEPKIPIALFVPNRFLVGYYTHTNEGFVLGKSGDIVYTEKHNGLQIIQKAIDRGRLIVEKELSLPESELVRIVTYCKNFAEAKKFFKEYALPLDRSPKTPFSFI